MTEIDMIEKIMERYDLEVGDRFLFGSCEYQVDRNGFKNLVNDWLYMGHSNMKNILKSEGKNIKLERVGKMKKILIVILSLSFVVSTGCFKERRYVPSEVQPVHVQPVHVQPVQRYDIWGNPIPQVVKEKHIYHETVREKEVKVTVTPKVKSTPKVKPTPKKYKIKSTPPKKYSKPKYSKPKVNIKKRR